MKTADRRDVLKGVARGCALAGLAALFVALLPRGRRVVCNDLCGSCPEYRGGKCSLGIK